MKEDNSKSFMQLVDSSEVQLPFDADIKNLAQMSRESFDLMPVDIDNIKSPVYSTENLESLTEANKPSFSVSAGNAVLKTTAKIVNDAIENPDLFVIKSGLLAAASLSSASGVGNIWAPALYTAAYMAPSNREQLGGVLVSLSPSGSAMEKFSKNMAAQGYKSTQIFEDSYGKMDPLEAGSLGAAIGSGVISMAQFASGAALGKISGLTRKGIVKLTGIMSGSQGFHEGVENDVIKYIEETGDYDLSGFNSGVKNLGINLASGAAQAGVEMILGPTGKLMPKGRFARIATTTGIELASNAGEEGAQFEFGGIAEVIKGNDSWKDFEESQGTAFQSVIVGAALGGVMAPFSYEAERSNHKKNMSAKLQELTPYLDKKTANKISENIISAMENKNIQLVNDEVVATVDASDDFGNMKQNYRLAALEHIKSRDLDLDLTEEESARLVEDTADIQTRYALIDSIERGLPLSKHPMNKAVGEKSGLWLEGKEKIDENIPEVDIQNDRISELRKRVSDFVWSKVRDRQLKTRDEIIMEEEKSDKLADLMASGADKVRSIRESKQTNEILNEVRIKEKALSDEKKLAERELKSVKSGERRNSVISNIRQAPIDDVKSFVKRKYKYEVRNLSDGTLRELSLNAWRDWEIVKPLEKIKPEYIKSRQGTINRITTQDMRDLSSFTGVPESVINKMTDEEYKQFYDKSLENKNMEKTYSIDKSISNLPDIDFQGNVESKGNAIGESRSSYDRLLKRIVLNENSDATSLNHEMAHYWIDRNLRYLSSGFASPEYEKRWNAISDWLGVEKGNKLTAKQSEKFARAYEKWLIDGEITNPEIAIILEKYRSFIGDIYEDVNEYFDTIYELNPEILEFFNASGAIENRKVSGGEWRINKSELQGKSEIIKDIEAAGFAEDEVKEMSDEERVFTSKKIKEIQGAGVVTKSVQQKEKNKYDSGDKKVSEHYKDIAKNIPDEDIEAMLNEGEYNSRITSKAVRDGIVLLSENQDAVLNALMNGEGLNDISAAELFAAARIINNVEFSPAILAVLRESPVGEQIRKSAQDLSAQQFTTESGMIDVLNVIKQIEKTNTKTIKNDVKLLVPEIMTAPNEILESEIYEFFDGVIC